MAVKPIVKTFEYFLDLLLRGFRKDQGREPNNLEMILIKQEAGGKAKDANKVIEVQFGKPFGEEVDKLIKSGDVKIGEVTKKNDNVLTREMFKDSNLNKRTIEGQMEKITEASNRLDEIMKEQADMYRPKTDAEIKAKFDKQNKESIKRLKKKKEDDPGFYTGGMIDVEPNLSDIGHGSDSLMARTRLVSPDGQATTSTGLNYLLAEDNDNIRVPFKGGGMGRRAFLKLLASIGGGVAAAKSGILSLGGKGATKQVAKEVATGSGTVPPYFLNLVSKIKNLGDDAPRLATKDRDKITTYKDYTLTEDVTTGEQTIQRMKVLDDGSESYYGKPLTEETYMNYKPGKGQMDETMKGKTPPDEYEEGTALLRNDKEFAGEVVDESATIADDVIEEGTMFEDNMTEFGKTKKADGGRIGFSKGKLATNAVKFLEKIFGKENMAEMPNRDPEMYQGMLEVVDMFRNRDTKGLKKYLQKYLPHMDDAQVEDFIVGDAEDMAGLGKFGLGNLQGQLIRLGSGRDYAGKIEALKRLERNKSLKDLEVTEDMQRKPNASGGLQTMLGE